MLRDHPNLLHSVNSIGETVLHWLAVENDAEGVSWLHARGADINTKNVHGAPVVFEVASLDYRDLLSWFIERGSDVRATNNDGQGIVEYLLKRHHSEMAESVRQYV